MKPTALLALLSTLVLASCNRTEAPAAPSGQVAYGLTSTGRIATFGLDNAARSLTTVNVSGLAAGEVLVDIDVRNTDNMLYGVTSSGKVYRINPTSGVAAADTAAVSGATVVAIDFNPVANRLRVIGANDLNFRLTLGTTPLPTGGMAGTLTADGTFAYSTASTNPNLVAAAYTNSFDNSASGSVTAGTSTALFSVDADTDQLVLHSNNTTTTPALPAGNFSSLTAVGALGVNVGVGSTGFDIAGANSAYLSSAMNSSTAIYTVDLATGAATLKTTLSGVALKSLALKLSAQ